MVLRRRPVHRSAGSGRGRHRPDAETHHMPQPTAQIARIAERQDLVVTTAQCIDLGADPDWLARQVTSGRWQRVHRGTLAVYSGPLTWRSCARAALLYGGRGAALSHAAAAYVHGLTDRTPKIIDLTIPQDRRVTAVSGLRVHRASGRQLDIRGRFVVVARADTAIDLLGEATTTDDAVGVLCATVRAGTHPEHLLKVLARRPKARGRRLALDLLVLVSAGIESPLELRYHRDVERRHGLPHAALQQRQVIVGLWIRADAVYEGLGVRVELDGQLGHPGGRTDDDTWRDNAVWIVAGEITLRYRWSHVAGDPCRTAVQVVAALRSRGWKGQPHPCGPGCPVR